MSLIVNEVLEIMIVVISLPKTSYSKSEKSLSFTISVTFSSEFEELTRWNNAWDVMEPIRIMSESEYFMIIIEIISYSQHFNWCCINNQVNFYENTIVIISMNLCSRMNLRFTKWLKRCAIILPCLNHYQRITLTQEC